MGLCAVDWAAGANIVAVLLAVLVLRLVFVVVVGGARVLGLLFVLWGRQAGGGTLVVSCTGSDCSL